MKEVKQVRIMDESNQRTLFASLTAMVVAYWGIPLTYFRYLEGLTGEPSGPLVVGGFLAPFLPFWVLFLLALVGAVLLTKLLERMTLSWRALLMWAVLLTGLLTGAVGSARKLGESRTRFPVGRNTVDGTPVALLFQDGNGGYVTRPVDLTARKLLPGVIEFPQAAAIPVWQPMELKR